MVSVQTIARYSIESKKDITSHFGSVSATARTACLRLVDGVESVALTSHAVVRRACLAVRTKHTKMASLTAFWGEGAKLPAA